MLASFVVLYVLVVGNCYDDILRMMEGNSWLDDTLLHFFHYPLLGALILCVPMALAGCVVALLLKLLKQRRMMPLSLLVPLFLAYIYPPKANPEAGDYRLFSKEIRGEEQYYSYVRLADEKKWGDLLSALRKDGNMDTALGMRYALLAESALGHLPDVLFSYPVRSPEDFLFRGVREPITCQFNRQFYENLGIYDEAFHQAMEYGLLQPEGCCLYTLRQLADYALKEGDVRVAAKYLSILDSRCAIYNPFASKTEHGAIGGEPEDSSSEAGKPLRDDNLIGAYPLRSEMVRLAYYQIGDEQKTLDYLLCSLLLEKNLEQFYKVLTQFPAYQQRALPRSYQEALEILESEGRALHDAPSGTYAYYFYNIQMAETGQETLMPSTN